jgi:Mannosyl-glycoprotein endo-beta-N-acetylglucosaminidase
MLHKKVTLLLLLLSAMLAHANPYYLPDDRDALSYIHRFSKLAVQEMHRSGIPASIKLAQAVLESGMGKGKLATMGNNHFGIKCKEEWTGATFHTQDDDYENGELVPSCFRKYETAEDSYRDHTDFLLNRKSRYKKLFDIEPSDYKKWAEGLKACGYATDELYAEKLVNIIETYNLSRFDTNTNLEDSDTNITASDLEKPVRRAKQLTIPATKREAFSDERTPPAFVKIPDNYKRNQYKDGEDTEYAAKNYTNVKYSRATDKSAASIRHKGGAEEVQGEQTPTDDWVATKASTGSILRSEYTFSTRLTLMQREIPKLHF